MDASFCLQLVICLTFMVLTTNAKGNGYFQCTQQLQKEITCSTTNLSAVSNGFFDCSSNSDVSKGIVCRLICDDGFYPASSNQIVCEAGATDQEGEWSNGSFVCAAITCQEVDLPTVEAGFFNCSGYSVGDRCNLTCKDGYYPSSSVETVCEENDDFEGNWSVGIFQCSECNEWNEWKDKEYKFIVSKHPWNVSRQLCEEESGHLVTIENKEENDFVHKVMLHCADDKATWIGLNDRDTEGMWEWSDGTVFQYENWNSQEPTGSRDENCVRIDKNSGKWHDRKCLNSHPAMCEREYLQ